MFEESAMNSFGSVPVGGANDAADVLLATSDRRWPTALTAMQRSSEAGNDTPARPSLPLAASTTDPAARASSIAARTAGSPAPPAELAGRPRLMLRRSQRSDVARSIALAMSKFDAFLPLANTR